MAPSLVIKVKYGETLRRFTAHVEGNQLLELNMEKLRVKIRSLFNFPFDTDFSLTYIDEDDDQVTLANDEDLSDVMRQGLNPVRMSVHLNADTSSRSASQTLPENLIPNVAEVLKSVPEPLRCALSKLSHDLASKATSTSPVLADIVDSLSKIGQSYLYVPQTNSPTQDVVRDGLKFTSEVSTNEEMKSNVVGSAGFPSESTQPSDVVGLAKGAELVIPPFFSAFPFQREKDSILHPSGNSVLRSSLSNESENKKSEKNMPGMVKAQLKDWARCPKEAIEAHQEFKFGNASSRPTVNLPSLVQCPITGLSLPPWHDKEPYIPPSFQTTNGNFNIDDGMDFIFHRGVRCDGCGVLPISGPRFKSNAKHDHDLCDICFTRMGTDKDYTRIDFPLRRRPPWSLKRYPMSTMIKPHGMMHPHSKLDSHFIMDVNILDGTIMAPSTPFTKIWRMHNNGNLPWSHGLQLFWIGGDRFSASDSIEIEIPVDGVNIGNELDIAVDFIAPELPGQYISHWMMAEPSGLQFGQRIWVLIQVDASLSDSSDGSSRGLDLNLPPQGSGTMASPVVKFERPLHSSSLEAGKSSSVELKPKLAIGDLNRPISDDLLVDSDVSSSTSATPSSVSTSSTPSSSSVSTSATPPSVSTSDSADNPVVPVTSPISYPNIDDIIQRPCAPPLSYPTLSDNMSQNSSSRSTLLENDERNLEHNVTKNEVEEKLLKELDGMGFKQVNLNKEVLQMNKYDLEQSVDDLCKISEWDPMLEELQEMGFRDKLTNKKVLVKNNGSLTRAVMELIAGDEDLC